MMLMMRMMMKMKMKMLGMVKELSTMAKTNTQVNKIKMYEHDVMDTGFQIASIN